MQKWEYKIVQNPKIEELNRLGDEGWELIWLTEIGINYIFKRPKD